ncbi:amidohydrolase family protein [Croceibacterium sp. TMG7-5b_MA50]|uniref:amidohydrolase family protein n=1 Tax=Croceibacterium sp. TMG7-5b_MA50 TaxID=3121290 RepID=UPI0032215C10
MRSLLFVPALSLIAAPAMAEAPAFDVHVHLHDGEASLDAYEASLEGEADGPRYAAMWFGGPNGAPASDPAAIRAANDSILDLAGRHPGMIPVVTVHPYDGDAALQELTRVAARGARILKLHPHTQRFEVTDPRTQAVVQQAGQLDLIVLFDNANILPGDSEKLFNLALANPRTRFIFAHIGGMNFRFWNVLAAARTADGLVGDNIHFDPSAIVTLVAGSPVADEFVWTLRNVGIRNVLLGSDYPQYSLAANIAALEQLGLEKDEIGLIRSGNARRLLGLEAAAPVGD